MKNDFDKGLIDDLRKMGLTDSQIDSKQTKILIENGILNNDNNTIANFLYRRTMLAEAKYESVEKKFNEISETIKSIKSIDEKGIDDDRAKNGLLLYSGLVDVIKNNKKDYLSSLDLNTLSYILYAYFNNGKISESPKQVFNGNEYVDNNDEYKEGWVKRI